jgi:YHS domain-containing protein
MRTLTFIIGLWTTVALAFTPEHPDRNEAEYNFQYQIVLDGYDPVSYFNDNGELPLKGRAELAFTYGNRTYHFATRANKIAFKNNPLLFEPTYGSWCAWAMANGRKARIDPLQFTVVHGRLNVFASVNAKNSFDQNIRKYQENADDNWFDISGEHPRG